MTGTHFQYAKRQRVTRGEKSRGKYVKGRRGSPWQSQHSEREILKNRRFLSRLFASFFLGGKKEVRVGTRNNSFGKNCVNERAKKKLALGGAKLTPRRRQRKTKLLGRQYRKAK
ncbi:MAG: hypothetical protein IJF15_03320, partial [Oscillospiraceae bacterium]|nr:hypothetical protein [Oscillospiraceae bacterium]